MTLENTQSIVDLEKYIDDLKEKIGKPLVKNIIKRAMFLASIYTSQITVQNMTQLSFLAYCDGKIGEEPELRQRFNEWLKLKMGEKNASKEAIN